MKCPKCGEELCWDRDVPLYEIDDEIPETDTAIVTHYTCLNCGTIVEASEPRDEEKVHYPYWNR